MASGTSARQQVMSVTTNQGAISSGGGGEREGDMTYIIHVIWLLLGN